MPISLLIQIDPGKLNNPDLDIRYELPDSIKSISGGRVRDNGYDFTKDPDHLLIFLEADLRSDLVHVIAVLENERLLENDLRQGSVVAIKEDEDFYRIVYPLGLEGIIKLDH